ncbi:hypothetical protein Saa2_08973 [Streptomyces acidiscabies]|nr:hypothetical protein Saa2_08973 [Streptomyces acidiscabies]
MSRSSNRPPSDANTTADGSSTGARNSARTRTAGGVPCAAGLDHAELVLAHRVHDQLGVLGVLREVQGPGLDAALGQVPLVEADLLGLDALQLQQVLSLPHRERVLPVLLLEGEFLLPSAVLHGPVELEPVLLPGTAVHLGVDAHAVLRRADLLVRAVVDGLEPALVVDGLLVAA